MKTACALLVLIVGAVCPVAPESPELAIPIRIKSCVESPQLDKKYEIDARVNPYYLRGDVDGDGKSDVAVRIRRTGKSPTGLPICQGNGRVFVLGAGSQPSFSTMDNDNFLSSDWEVFTLEEFHTFLSDSKLGARAKGEVIALHWEDGAAHIYWDGNQYRWLADSGAAPDRQNVGLIQLD